MSRYIWRKEWRNEILAIPYSCLGKYWSPNAFQISICIQQLQLRAYRACGRVCVCVCVYVRVCVCVLSNKQTGNLFITFPYNTEINALLPARGTVLRRLKPRTHRIAYSKTRSDFDNFQLRRIQTIPKTNTTFYYWHLLPAHEIYLIS